MALDPQAAAAVALWRRQPSPAGADPARIAELRRTARAEAATQPREAVASVSEVDATGVPCRLYRPTARTGGAVLFAHGGGFVFGDLDTHDAHARRLANRTGLAVLAVDYRRPPEDRFPAAHDDVTTAARWLAAHADELGIDRSRVVSLGDSAGGSLALVAALRDPLLFAATVLVYPFVDPRLRSGSVLTEGEHGFSRAEAEWFWRTYAGGAERVGSLLDDPAFCPLDAPGLGVLPPTQVLVAEHDLLRDEGLLLAERIGAAGARVEVVDLPGLVHGFWRHPELFDAAEASYAATAAFLAAVL